MRMAMLISYFTIYSGMGTINLGFCHRIKIHHGKNSQDDDNDGNEDDNDDDNEEGNVDL